MPRLACALGVVALFLIALSDHAVTRDCGSFQNVVFHSCYDGDTCTFTLPGVHPLFGNHIPVRLRGVDAPEVRGRCYAEKREAVAARDYLDARLRAARRIDLLDVERGKYFRIVTVVIADGVDVAGGLIRRGLE